MIMLNKQLNVLNGELSPNKMKSIKNNIFSLKPSGGLWTSSYIPVIGSDWVQYSFQVGGFRIPETEKWDGFILYPNADAKIYKIDSYKDLERLMLMYRIKSKLKFPNFYAKRKNFSINFEEMAKDFDGIHLTRRGKILTKNSYPYNLDGWDVESTVWFRWIFDKVIPIQETFVQVHKSVAINRIFKIS